MTTGSDAFKGFDATTTLAKMRKGFFWAGLVMVVLGMAAVLMPFFSSLVVEILIGWLLTMSGAVVVIGAFSFRRTGMFLWQLFSGLITVMAGLLLLLFPLQGLIALTVLVAFILVFTGAAQFAFALWARPAPGWSWALMSAAISILLGVLIVFALPQASAVTLGLIVGIDFISTGVALMLISRSVREEF